MNPQASEILQRIYDSEINLSIGWMWDGGIDYKIGSDLDYIKGEVISSGFKNFEEAVKLIALEVAAQYPNSEFSKWFNSTDFTDDD